MDGTAVEGLLFLLGASLAFGFLLLALVAYKRQDRDQGGRSTVRKAFGFYFAHWLLLVGAYLVWRTLEHWGYSRAQAASLVGVALGVSALLLAVALAWQSRNPVGTRLAVSGTVLIVLYLGMVLAPNY